ncbi:hypothetical protein L2729_13145 [Shewanella gelidimarina]|uniref:hypothetical protein n=1 Tax=Shewanella gelidimarina TaxID=56813 RepID=UPI00200D351E|nr:hypothetical protein [Shewanella gelidimarina]MCL1058920.1 hypothetical protein [Shewanella gelidimarina]
MDSIISSVMANNQPCRYKTVGAIKNNSGIAGSFSDISSENAVCSKLSIARWHRIQAQIVFKATRYLLKPEL